MHKQKWERELLDFCQSYQFENANGGVLGVGIEECSYVGKTDRAFVQFNARMLGQGLRPPPPPPLSLSHSHWQKGGFRLKTCQW